MKKTLAAISGLLLAAPLAALALGQLTSPIEVTNARRGQVIQERLILNNSDDRELELAVSGQGDIAQWATFYLPGDRQTQVTSVKIPAKSNIEAYVKLVVPDDARNGAYNGTIQVSQGPGASEQKVGVGAAVGLSTSRKVSITVTDKEEVAFTAQVIPVSYDVKPGDPLEIKLLYRNQGNVLVSPQASVAVKQDGKIVGDETVYRYPSDLAPVKPGEEGSVNIQWPTYKLSEGKYRAYVTASVGDVTQANDFAFNVSKAVVSSPAASAPSSGFNPRLVVGGIAVVVALVGGLLVAGKKRKR